MALYPVSGCKIFIGEDPMDEQSADFVAADFTAVVWTEIAKWTQMGPFGDTAQLITTDLISEGRTKKQKGTRNAGSMQNVFAVDNLDEGQIALLAAEKTFWNYPIKVELNDKPDPAGTNSLRFFIALIMQAQDAGGGANTIQTLNAMFEINSNVVHVEAVAGP